MFAACGVPEDKFRTICSAVDKLDKVGTVSWNLKHIVIDGDLLTKTPIVLLVLINLTLFCRHVDILGRC